MTRKITLTRGVPPPESLPRKELASCFEHAVREDPSALQYGKMPCFPGHPALRTAISAMYGCSPEEVFVANGSLQILDMIAAALVRPGGVALVEEPCYDRAVRILGNRGARVVGVPLDEEGVSLDHLEVAIRKLSPELLYLVTDFQNPAGVTLAEHKRRAVADLARRYHVRTLEDVPYRDLRYIGEAPPLLRTFAPEHVVTMGSFSKTICPGVRIGFMLAAPDFVARIARIAEDTYLSPVVVTQAAVAEFLSRGAFAPNLEALKALYRPRWEAATAAIRELPVERCFLPQGGFFVSAFFAEGANTVRLVERARARDLELSPGETFFAESDGRAIAKDRFLRIAFQGVSPADLREGIGRLRELLVEHRT